MNPLVPVPPDRHSPLVTFSSGGVAAVVRVDGIDRRRRVIWYLLRIGGMRGTVVGRMIGILPGGKQVELTRLTVEGGPFSESRFAISQHRGERFTQVYLDLRSDDLALRVEAPPPIIRSLSRPLRTGAAVGSAMLMVATGALAATALAFAVPRPPLLAAPSVAAAGEVAHIAYVTRGVGTASYWARDKGGRLLGGDTLPGQRGTIDLPLPRDVSRGRVEVSVQVAGVFGSSTGLTGFNVVPPAATMAASDSRAQIASFSARRDKDDNSESILASYLAVGETGTITVVDGKGHTVGSAPFSHAGTTRIAVASGSELSTLTARLAVRRGTTRATSAITLTPLPAVAAATLAKAPLVAAVPDVAGNPPSSNDAPASAYDAPATNGVDDPFAVSGSAFAGQPLTVLIRRGLPGMRIALTDDVGTVLNDVAVPATAQSVTLTPPSATAARTYYLTCTYGSGNAQEVVVRSVRVLAR